MERYKNDGTTTTPTINFDLLGGTLEIKGRSIPENSVEFYKPLTEALKIYSNQPKETTTVTIELEYFNTSSAKCLLDFFKELEGLRVAGVSAVKIRWGYQAEDENILEAGKEYQTMLKIPFELFLLEE
ncbi:MAG: DUF1987 domain-containing protein [Sphingobacteriaceae bacterium]|nr:DUF1987 domain-containing protein [Sphingobacteriaceae bacterium]